jgi:hypothetical protein
VALKNQRNEIAKKVKEITSKSTVGVKGKLWMTILKR